MSETAVDKIATVEETWLKLSERERLAFLAGFICGEGSFTINNAESCSPVISVVNTDRTVIDLLQLQFGGTVRERPVYKNWKQTYGWTILGRKAKAVIEAITPFLVMKRDQAQIVSMLCDLIKEKSGPGVSEEVMELRYELAETLRDLNRKGRDVIE